MKICSCWRASAAIGCLAALTPLGLAQTAGTVLREMPDGSVQAVPCEFVVNHAFQGGGEYGGRAVTVLDNMTGAFTNVSRSALGVAHTLDVFSFSPGPWATSTRRVATSFSFNMFLSRWDGPTSPPVACTFRGWNASAFWTTVGGTMIPPSADLAFSLTYQFPTGFFDGKRPDPGYIILLMFPDTPLDTTPGAEQMQFAGAAMLFEQAIHDPKDEHRLAWYPSAGATNPDPARSLYIPIGENVNAPSQLWGIWFMTKPTSPGSSPDVGYGRDVNGDGVFSPNNAGGEYRNSANRHNAIEIKGIVCPCLADFDGSGGTPDVGDIGAFFDAWVAGDSAADTDCSGSTPDAADIDDFFGQWLAGGC